MDGWCCCDGPCCCHTVQCAACVCTGDPDLLMPGAPVWMGCDGAHQQKAIVAALLEARQLGLSMQSCWAAAAAVCAPVFIQSYRLPALGFLLVLS